MVQLIRGLLFAVAVVLPATTPDRAPSTYFHFHNISSGGDFEAGHVRGNPWHWVSRLEHQHGASNSGQVRWSGKGSTGTQVWDLDHGHLQDLQVEQPENHQRYPDRKSGRDEPKAPARPGPGCPLLAGLQATATGHPQGLHHRLQRRSHSTLITRDCQGNPLEPPGVRLSPGPPRSQPRLPLQLQPLPPPPAPAAPAWRLADQTQPPPPPPPRPDMYLHINKRAGELGGGAGETPRGFEPTAQEDQEGQEDHLRGMTHADGQLMFGDGSYQAPSAAALKHLLQRPLRLPLKRPTTVVVRGPLKGTSFKGPVAVRLQPFKAGGVGAPIAAPAAPAAPSKARPKPVVARLKPMVVLVKPTSSNRLPMGGAGPAGAARPLPLREWLSSMLGRM